MSKRLIGVLGATLLLFSLAVVVVGQTPATPVTKVQAIQNSDGTYTIVEYPVDKEITVTLNPVGLSGATGKAIIMRKADGTNIKLNLSGLPAEATAVNVYAVDPTGAVTLLGQAEVASGAGALTTTTALTKFMLVATPDPNLSAYNENSIVYFRSAPPAGLTVIPLANALGETVAAVAVPAQPAVVPVTPTETVVPATTAQPAVVVPVTPAQPAVVVPVTPAQPAVVLPVTPTQPATVVVPVTPAQPAAVVPVTPTEATVAVVANEYTVPMIGIGNFQKGDDTKLKINFTGEMEGARANVFIEPHKNGKISEVRMRFHELKEAPKGKAFVLWAQSPDGQFARLGQVINVKGRNEAEIKSEVSFDDFGLLLTTEDLNPPAGAIIRPAGHRVGVIQIAP